MNQRDVYLFGLLALGFLYLRGRRPRGAGESQPAAPSPAARPAPDPLGLTVDDVARVYGAELAPARGTAVVVYEAGGGVQVVPVRARASGGCPRDAEHPVVARADGAKWCRHCDRGFYPTLPGLDAPAHAA